MHDLNNDCFQLRRGHAKISLGTALHMVLLLVACTKNGPNLTVLKHVAYVEGAQVRLTTLSHLQRIAKLNWQKTCGICGERKGKVLADCSMYKEWAKLNCPKTCGICGGNPGKVLTDCDMYNELAKRKMN